jgi:hypothetical protein
MSAKGIPDVLSKSPEQGICRKIYLITEACGQHSTPSSPHHYSISSMQEKTYSN